MYYCLLLLSLFMSSALADEVAGFDIGGPLKDDQHYTEIENQPKNSHLYHVDKVKFFDYARLTTDDKRIIKNLFFYKTYRVSITTVGVESQTILKDFKRILASLEKRYGEFDKQDAQRLLGFMGKMSSFYFQKIDERAYAVPKKTKSIGAILLRLSSPDKLNFALETKPVILSLMYIDKATFAESVKKSNAETEGF